MSVNKGLSLAQRDEMIELLNKFVVWLKSKQIINREQRIKYFVKMPASKGDWVMKVDGDKIEFNTFMSSKCDFEFYKLVILHEFFHLRVQRVPNKADATRVKDAFGDQFMKLIDIEADYFTALFFKEELAYGLVDYMRLSYNGNILFLDSKIRPGKLERFIGTLLSIVKMYIDNASVDFGKVSKCDLYLPTISPVYTENSLRILVISKEHIYLDEIKAGYRDFIKVKECYSYSDSMNEKKYVDTLLRFSHKALQKRIPAEIKTEISKIP